MEILEERNILTEFMKYPLNNPKKDLDLQVLSLHLRPITRNGMDRSSPHSGQTIDGEIQDVVTQPAKPKANYKAPQTPKSKRRQELEYEKLIKKYFRRKGRSKHRSKPRRPPKVRTPQGEQEKEEGVGYKEVKRKNLKSRRIEHFTRSSRNKEPKRKRLSESRKVKPIHEDLQTTWLPGSWADHQTIGNWVDIGQLELPPMIDGEVLDEENPMKYNPLGGENYTRNGVRDGKLPPDNQQLWRRAVPVRDIPIIDIYSDTIQHAETHSGPYKEDHLWIQGDRLLQTEGSGSYNTMGQDQENKIISLIPNESSAQTPQETQEIELSQPTATIQPSSNSTSRSTTDRAYTEVPSVTQGEESLDGLFRPLEATMTRHPERIYCKPGYKEYGGVCRSQCVVGGMNCGKYGQCVIVENIGAMCRCQQINSLCYGGDCCQSSLTTFQLAAVVGGCFILLSVSLASLPFLIRRVDIKAISKSVRTRLWISNLMQHSSTSLSSQSVDLTVCSDYHSAPDLSTLYRTKEVACNSTMWQCERTRL
ncbi:uncharacterized protein [Dendropsophus ebraccatus]|uniref:uncharacterized protein n=1 Tax=Dendropsophus ebraccatus TaxID=150705 RepID=UPI0038311EA4